MNRPRESRDTQPTAIGYVHTSKVGPEGLAAVAAGRRAIKALSVKHGLQLVACEADMGAGSRIARRAVLSALRTRGAAVLLLPALCHLSRSGRFASAAIDRLLARGQDIVTADGSFDSRTQPGRLMLSIMRVFAEVERETLDPTMH
jgi:DNA invertase Pin-like site-specific DNA recombinase